MKFLSYFRVWLYLNNLTFTSLTLYPFAQICNLITRVNSLIVNKTLKGMWTDFFEVLMLGSFMCLGICGCLHSEESKFWKSFKGFGYIKGRWMCLTWNWMHPHPLSSLEFDLITLTLSQYETQKFLCPHWVNLEKYPSELNKYWWIVLSNSL